MPKTLYQKIALLLYPGLAIVVGLSFYLLLQHERYQIMQDILKMADDTSQVIESSLHHAMLSRDIEETQTIVESLRERLAIIKLFILDREGQVAFPMGQKKRQRVDPKKGASCRVCHRDSVEPILKTIIYSRPDGAKVLRTVNPVENLLECHSCHNPTHRINGVIITDTSMAGLEAKLSSQLKLMLLSAGITFIILAVGLELAFRRFINKPISLLLKGTRELKAGNLSFQVPINTKDELGELAGSFNEMAISLYKSKEDLLKTLEEAEQLNAELMALYYLIQKICNSLEIEVLSQIVLDHFANIIDSDTCYLALFPRSLAPFLRVKLKTRESDEIRAYDIDLEHIRASTSEKYSISYWERLIRERIPDINLLCPLDNGNTHSLANFIEAKEQRIGYVTVYKGREPSFGPREKRLFTSFTQCLSPAIYNSILYELAITDELTGLYSRRFFEEVMETQLETHKRSSTPLSLLMIDLDNLKVINDTHGHPIGDKALKGLASSLKDASRAMDIVSRIGGDEFAILLPRADAEAAAEVANRIMTRIKAYPLPAEDLERPIIITLSLGSASFPEDATTAKELILTADQALYRAKGAGGDRLVLYSPI